MKRASAVGEQVAGYNPVYIYIYYIYTYIYIYVYICIYYIYTGVYTCTYAVHREAVSSCKPKGVPLLLLVLSIILINFLGSIG